MLFLLACKSPVSTEVSAVPLVDFEVRLDRQIVAPNEPAGGVTHRIAPMWPPGPLHGNDWTLDVPSSPGLMAVLEGDEEFLFLTDSLGLLIGVRCQSEQPGFFEATLVFTHSEQGDRATRIPLSCEVDPRSRALPPPFLAQEVTDEGRVFGVFPDEHAFEYVFAAHQPGTLPMQLWTGQFDADIVRPGLIDGRMSVTTRSGIQEWIGEQVFSRVADVTPNSSYAFSDGLFYVTAELLTGQLHKADDSGSVPIGEPTFGLEVKWASEDGRYVVVAFDNDPVQMRLHDTHLGTSEPFQRPEGGAWIANVGRRLFAMDDARTTLLLPYHLFGEAHLWRVDLATNTQTDLLETAVAHALSIDPSGDGVNIPDFDVTPDFRYAAVVFDNIDADGGGFRGVYSGVYVVDLVEGTTWVASVTPARELIDYVHRDFERLIEQVAIAPGGDKVLFGYNVVTDRELWIELQL